MKKKIGRLTLTKETLRSLETPSLNHVVGGVTAVTCPGMNTCPAHSCVVCSTRCSDCCP